MAVAPAWLDIPAAAWRGAVVFGIVVGVAYTLTPLTVLMLTALAALWLAAGRGLEGGERAWVVRSLAFAIVVRVVVIAALLLLTDPGREQYRSLFPDGKFVVTRSLWIRDFWLGGRLAPDVALDVFDPYGGDTYFYVFAAVQTMFGPAPYALTLFSVFFSCAGAVGLHRLVRYGFGRVPAMLVFWLMLFVPTLFFWSVSMLKDGLFISLMIAAIAGVFWSIRGSGAVRAVALAGTVLALAGVDQLRGGGLLMTLGGLGIGLTGWALTRRPWVLAVGLGLLIAVAPMAMRRPVVRDGVFGQIQLAANRHIGHVHTEGHAYKLLDDRFYIQGAESAFTIRPDEMVRFLVRSVVSFVVVPTPMQVRSRSELLFMPQQMLWYVLVLLAIPGFVVGLRREPLLTWLLAGYVAAAVAVIAPNSGNVGTLTRHRDMALPFVACLGAVGLIAALGWITDSFARRIPRAMRPAHV